MKNKNPKFLQVSQIIFSLIPKKWNKWNKSEQVKQSETKKGVWSNAIKWNKKNGSNNLL